MSHGPITVWLERWRAGDPEALDQLLPLVYGELREVARRQLRRESPAHTLSATGLVHEAYLRLLSQRQLVAVDRTHFFAIAARTMRRILVDHARARLAQKRGGERPAALDDQSEPAFLGSWDPDELLDTDAALSRLAERSERAVRVIECRVFAELTLEETADALGLSRKSVQRTWTAAAAWLRKELGRSGGESGA
jgi:RNA polymerase sigma factor (TIGR02999 family)